jgi:hypothetical protein
MTDFRALCADLLTWADKASAHYYQSPDVLVRARAALAEPQPAADGVAQPIPVSERLPEALPLPSGEVE